MISGGSFKTNRLYLSVKRRPTYLSVMMTEIPKLESDQEEIDARVVLYCSYAVDEEYNYVRVRSAESHIFFILLCYASKINIILLFDTGFRCKRRLLNISQLTHDFTPLYQNALLSLYVFSRCDTSSAFKDIWKSEAHRTPSKKTQYQAVFKSPKKSWDVSENLFL